jgi:hypothetical protein
VSRLILGERPSSGGPHPTILASPTTRQLDRIMPDWRLSFDTCNIWPYHDTDEDMIDIDYLLDSRRYEVIVALGHIVAKELGLPRAPWLSWHELGGVAVLKMPHPSGLNRWWNDPVNRTFAQLAMTRAIRHCSVS